MARTYQLSGHHPQLNCTPAQNEPSPGLLASGIRGSQSCLSTFTLTGPAFAVSLLNSRDSVPRSGPQHSPRWPSELAFPCLHTWVWCPSGTPPHPHLAGAWAVIQLAFTSASHSSRGTRRGERRAAPVSRTPDPPSRDCSATVSLWALASPEVKRGQDNRIKGEKPRTEFQRGPRGLHK